MGIHKQILLLFFLLQPAWVSAERVYTMGVVPQYSSQRLEDIWTPILDMVSKLSGLKFKLIGAPSIPEFERQFQAGVFDVAYMNPYHVLISNRAQGYLPVARDVGRNLYGIIVVRKDSDIQSVQDLQGKTVAFPSANAIGASLMPRAEFARKYQIPILPKYVNSHDSVYLNVALGQAEAGGGVQKTLERQPGTIRERLRVLYKTQVVSPHPIVIHPRVPAKDAGLIQKAFLELGQNERGRDLLTKVPINHIGVAKMSDYKSIEDMNLDEFFVREN